MFNRNEQKVHMGTLGHLCRRGVAFVLAAAMSLSLLPAAAWAAVGPLAPPTQVTNLSEFPNIEVEVNMVRTEYGTLTNTVEIALRVGPSEEDKPVRFQALATTLQINTTLLKPIDWTWVADLDPDTQPPTPITLTDADTSTYYDVQIPAKKDDTRTATGAVAQCGIVSKDNAPDGMSENVANGDQALLFFKAESYGEFIELDKMTTLAVIRCYADPTLMNHIAIVRNADGSYTVTSDVFQEDTTDPGDTTEPTPIDKTITTVARLNQVAGILADPSGDALADGEAPLELPTGFTTVGFAEDMDIALSRSEAGLPLHYDTGTNQYYFIPGDVLGDTAAGWTTVTERIGGVDYTLDAPQTANEESRILAVGTGDPLYSYTSNLIPANNISFTVVSEMSFADQGVDLDRYSILVFVDWDNTLLGALVVPKYENVASIVNEYIVNNFVHTDLQNPTAEQMASVARKDTYRGKYPYDRPRVEGDPDGEQYTVLESEYKALTNKLDYAFLRRPMEREVDDLGNPTADNTWVQKVDENGDTYYDTYFPYAYGWAKCTAENYVDTWTTLGTTGELNSYAVTNGVAKVTSTDKNFQIADLVKGFGKNDSTVFLKAIYEPGDSLLPAGASYRLYTTPAYNKLNYSAASAGGAYSVSLQLERSNTDNGFVQGAVRTREPYIRLQASPDYRWKTEDTLSIRHNLTNPTLEDVSGDLTETTYILVEVENSEIMDVTLTLSAKHYMINYYLIDGYSDAKNFVAGDETLPSNYDESVYSDYQVTSDNIYRYGKGTADYVIRNYNYYVSGESEHWDPTGYFFNVVPFDDKDGSHGFVLYGTLNSLMQKATQYNNYVAKAEKNAVEESVFNFYTRKDAFDDANLRLDREGTLPTNGNAAQFRVALRAAAELCRAHKGKNDESDYWDSRLDCARLTYHQLQWFLIDYNEKGAAATLLDPITADNSAHKLTWCRLHSTCAAGQSKKPLDWPTLLERAQSSDPTDRDAIANLTVAEFEGFAHLRSSVTGAAFSNSFNIRDAVVNAVASLNGAGQPLTWDNIQYAIIHPNNVNNKPEPIYPNGIAAQREIATYWWYDGDTTATVDSWTELMTALEHSTTGADYPDGVHKVTEAKLNNLEVAFSAGLNSAPWIAATHNLAVAYTAATDTPELSGTFAQVKTQLQNAYKALGAGGAEENTWRKYQFYLLNGRAPVAGNPADESEMAGYWWYDGNFKVKDTASLVRAAKDPTGNAWRDLTLEDVYIQPGLQFRKDFAGTPYDANAPPPADELKEFKDAVLSYVADPDHRTDNWAHLQYYLIYGVMADANLSYDANYYWWKDGGAPYSATYDMSSSRPEIRANALGGALAGAAFRAKLNGCAATAFSDLSDSTILRGRLIKTYDSNKDFTDQEKPTVGEVISAAKELISDSWTGPVTPTNPVPTFTWEDVQRKLLGLAPGDALPDDGWWKSDDKNPASKRDAEADFNTLVTYIEAVADAYWDGDDMTTPVAALNAFLTSGATPEEIAQNMGFYGPSGTRLITAADLEKIAWENVEYDSWDACCWGEDDDEPFHITWYQIQNFILTGMQMGTADDAFLNISSSYGTITSTIPQWVKDRFNPATYALMTNALALPQGADVEVDPDTGIITTTSPDAITELPGGLVQVQRTVTVLSPQGHILEIITMIEIYDTEYNLISEQTITMPAPEPEAPEASTEPEEPVCACGSEDDTHTEDCPLYEAPEAPTEPEEPVCACGSEDDTHAEDCPLYVASEEGGEDAAQEPAESPEPDETEERKDTWATMPEFVDPDTLEPEKPEEPEETDPPVTAPADSPQEPEESPDGETDLQEGGEVIVTETPPPLGETPTLQTRSGSTGYKGLATRIVTWSRRPETGQIKLLLSAGGMKMKQLNLKRIISPPGWRAVPLLLRSESMEGRRAL